MRCNLSEIWGSIVASHWMLKEQWGISEYLFRKLVLISYWKQVQAICNIQKKAYSLSSSYNSCRLHSPIATMAPLLNIKAHQN